MFFEVIANTTPWAAIWRVFIDADHFTIFVKYRTAAVARVCRHSDLATHRIAMETQFLRSCNLRYIQFPRAENRG